MKKLLILLAFLLPMAASAQSKKDTLVVPAHIKVIVIDGISYDVVRSVELKKADANPWSGLMTLPFRVDSIDIGSKTLLKGFESMPYYGPQPLIFDEKLSNTPGPRFSIKSN